MHRLFPISVRVIECSATCHYQSFFCHFLAFVPHQNMLQDEYVFQGSFLVRKVGSTLKLAKATLNLFQVIIHTFILHYDVKEIPRLSLASVPLYMFVI